MIEAVLDLFSWFTNYDVVSLFKAALCDVKLCDLTNVFTVPAHSLKERLQVGFSTLRELTLKRPAAQQQLLQTLLELTTNEKEQVRVQAIHSAKKLHTRPELAESIEVKHLYGARLVLFHFIIIIVVIFFFATQRHKKTYNALSCYFISIFRSPDLRCRISSSKRRVSNKRRFSEEEL